MAVGAFAASLLLGLLVPIYTDEIGWRFQARAALDGGVDRFVAEHCGLNTLARPPLLMMPLRHLGAWVNLALADPVYVRLTGVLCAFGWAAMLLWVIRSVSRDAEERATLTLLGFGLLGLGVLPLLLVMSRPEQPILLALTAALLVAVTGRGGENHGRSNATVRAGAVVLAGGFALGFHPKAVAFMPVFLACAAFSSRDSGGRLARAGGVVALLSLTAMALPYWTTRFQCPGDPIVAAKLAGQSLASTLFGASPLAERLGAGLKGGDPTTYVNLILPRAIYTSDWLPAGLVGKFNGGLWALAIRVAWLGSLLIAAILLFRPLARCVRRRAWEGVTVMAAIIVAVTLGWGIVQLEKNDYEAALALPMLVLFVVLALRAAALGATGLRRVRLWAAPVALIALASQVHVAATYAGPLVAIARTPGYIPGQPFSFSAFGYGSVRPRIEAAGRMCGIDPSNRPRGLLIDDLTYFPYMASWRPLHRTGVLSTYNGRIGDPLAHLRGRGSAGMVIGCRYFPRPLRARARRSGEFCCIGPGA